MTAVDFDAFVHQLATVSGEAIPALLPHGAWHRGQSAGRAFDPVTEADRAAEQAMRQLIPLDLPRPRHHRRGVQRERGGGAPWKRALDPIDGTKSFIAGLPAWGTLIGLLKEGDPVYGMMHQPFIGERFFGDGGAAARRPASAPSPPATAGGWRTRCSTPPAPAS